MPDLEETLESALELINKLRAEFGVQPLDKMPPGIPGDPCNCPTAVALAPCGIVHVQPRWIQFDDVQLAARAEKAWFKARQIYNEGRTLVAIPRGLANFIDAFDGGDYPELLEIRER